MLAIIILVILIIALILLVFFVREQTKITGRAFTPGQFSAENSYLFASPLLAVANGQEKIRITIFALDSQGVGVPGRAVFLTGHQNLVADPVQSQTDSLGKAVFDLSSTAAAQYLIEVQIEGETLPQTLKVTFR